MIINKNLQYAVEETTTVITSILFPLLSIKKLIKKVILPFNVAVEKPLQMDMTTQNKIKPRCVRVKIEVDLWTIFSKRVNVELRKKSYEKVDKDQL
ncbi:hypothetical protein H5410_031460 [Solanum commersonii]|uniref:Uncharacterized protein n=1 Tax=Solanum commersonii TaxID=4109 RepID=A0A9J5YID1_SOLCO|nr:hypothetical protein H5410_031460 [Solanum commersonii]